MAAVSASQPIVDDLIFSPPVSILKYNLHVQQVRSSSYIGVHLERKVNESAWELIDSRNFALSTVTELDYTQQLFVDEKDSQYFRYRFRILTNYTITPVAITFSVKELPYFARYEVLLAATVLIGVYILIVLELVHRTIAAMIGAFVALAVTSSLEGRPSLETVISYIDFETCCLLFGMMMMVGIFSQTGFFEWCAVKAFKLSKGNMWKLVSSLCIFTAFISAFLDNVTTIMLIAPVTIRLCKVLEVPPTQVMISLVLFSNLGGTATAVGDPPNIMIISDPSIRESGQITFLGFALHCAPGVVMACVASWFVVRHYTKNSLQRKPSMQKIQEIQVWRNTAKKLSRNDPDERQVRQKLQSHIEQLENDLAQQKNRLTREVDITELEEKYVIHDMPLFINSSLILGLVICIFFMKHAVDLDLSYAWIAIIGAMVHLVASNVRDIEEVLEKVEFGTLLFFAALFVLMRCLESMGLIDFVGDWVSEVISLIPKGNNRLLVSVLIILWVSGLVSAVIDNIPYTAAMIPVVLKIVANDPTLPLTPLIWALAFGTCFGGNATLIGASANVVGAGISEAHGYPISFNAFLKTGFPTMIVSMVVASLWLCIFHVLIPWY